MLTGRMERSTVVLTLFFVGLLIGITVVNVVWVVHESEQSGQSLGTALAFVGVLTGLVVCVFAWFIKVQIRRDKTPPPGMTGPEKTASHTGSRSASFVNWPRTLHALGAQLAGCSVAARTAFLDRPLGAPVQPVPRPPC